MHQKFGASSEVNSSDGLGSSTIAGTAERLLKSYV